MKIKDFIDKTIGKKSLFAIPGNMDLMKKYFHIENVVDFS